jgi:xylan 1,4-beta-xylosidase
MLREGVRGDRPDVSAVAAIDTVAKRLTVLAWHYHDDDLPGPDADVELTIAGLPAATAGVKVRHYRIDETHSNAFTAWKAMGSPQTLAPEHRAKLESAGGLELLWPDEGLPVEAQRAVLRFKLPRQGVSLVELGW